MEIGYLFYNRRYNNDETIYKYVYNSSFVHNLITNNRFKLNYNINYNIYDIFLFPIDIC